MAERTQSSVTSEGLVTMQVSLRVEHAAILKACAAREGASPEALAALWLEEKADAARKGLPTNHQPAKADE